MIWPTITNRLFPFLFLLSLVFAPCRGLGQATTVFSGTPMVKISEAGVERIPVALRRADAVNLGCVISRIGDQYYWASRENKSMVRIDGGAFITFLAADGAGYVRVIAPGMKGTVSMMAETEKQFDYVEHLLIGLGSVTYYGASK